MTIETTTAVVMYGKPVAAQIESRVAAGARDLIARCHTTSTLAIVQVGKNPASERYVRRKIEACARLGMRATLYAFDDDISGNDLKCEVSQLSLSHSVHGILVQLPLPRHIEEAEPGATNKYEIFDAIAPEKDVDGVSGASIPELYRAQQDRLRFLAGTALAVRRMISFYGIRTEGKQAVVIGRNDITAKPILHMLGGRMCNAAAVWCHRYVSQEDQHRFIRTADILVSAVGSQHYQVTGDMLKPGVVVFDIATRIDAAGKIKGDVDFETAKQVASCITPVPGGVGPVTVAALTENLLRAAQFACGIGHLGYMF